MLARLESVESLENPPVLVAVVAPRSDFTAAVDASVRSGTLLALAAFLLGFAAIAFMSWRIAQPLGVLTREAQAIRRLELAAPLVLRSRITEVERLAEAIAAMKATLTSFAVYLPRDLVRQFLAAGAEPRLGGERIALSVMFSDMQGFTTIAENLDPMELTHIASAYFEEVTRELLAGGATIDKYIGDAVMAFWNAPHRDPDHAAHACAAALGARAVTQRLTEVFAARGWPPLDALWRAYRRSGRGQCRLQRSHDLYGDGRDGEFCKPAGGLEQALWHADPRERGDARGGRSGLRVPSGRYRRRQGHESPIPVHELLGFADRARLRNCVRAKPTSHRWKPGRSASRRTAKAVSTLRVLRWQRCRPPARFLLPQSMPHAWRSWAARPSLAGLLRSIGA